MYVLLTPYQNEALHSYRHERSSADRVQKLKDARSEAAKEIEAYKVQKQKDYEAYESEVSPLPCKSPLAQAPPYTNLPNPFRKPIAQEPDFLQPAHDRRIDAKAARGDQERCREEPSRGHSEDSGTCDPDRPALAQELAKDRSIVWEMRRVNESAKKGLLLSRRCNIPVDCDG